MACPDAFRNSAGAFFIPKDCAGCKLLKTEKTSLRTLTVYYCQNLDSHSTCNAKLVSVIDGDTILVDLGQRERVRLLGIDSPEKSEGDHAEGQCSLLGVDPDTLKVLAKLSQIHLCGLCPAGSILTLQTTGKVRDNYGRLLAGVFLDDQCINRRMVEDGYAIAYTNLSDWEDYSSLEQQARESGKGIFGACEESFYAANTKSYHRPGCFHAKWATARIAPREEAANAGLSACSACLPDFALPVEEQGNGS
jgi:endonuclease YncB( thermonuclease family)